MALNIQKVAADTADGTFFVKTQGLEAHGHAELEIVGIPRPAVEPAAKLIDYVIETVIEGKGVQLKARENVGIPLLVGGHEEIPAVFVGVHAAEGAPPAGGFFSKLRGTATKGVLRLVDLPGSQHGPPFAALASMMLYRSNCRFVTGDHAGAIAELNAGIEMTPGDPSAGPPPQFDTGDAELNWQNHVSYLRLAELLNPVEAGAVYRNVFSRFSWLSRRELGCLLGELNFAAGPSAEQALIEEALNIIRGNVGRPAVAPGPHPGLRFVASPLWTPREDGTSVREASLIPAGFLDYYFGGRLAEPAVAEALARLAAECVARHAQEPWKVSFMTRGAREMYKGMGAALPASDVIGPSRPTWFLLSAVIAEAARYLHAGGTYDELRSTFGLSGTPPELPESLAAKVVALETWEAQQYMTGIGGPS